MFGNGFGDAGVDLAGDGDEVFGPGEIGEGDGLEVASGLPAEADAGLVEYGIIPGFPVGDQDGVVNDCFNRNGFDNELTWLANGIMDGIFTNRGVFE